MKPTRGCVGRKGAVLGRVLGRVLGARGACSGGCRAQRGCGGAEGPLPDDPRSSPARACAHTTCARPGGPIQRRAARAGRAAQRRGEADRPPLGLRAAAGGAARGRRCRRPSGGAAAAWAAWDAALAHGGAAAVGGGAAVRSAAAVGRDRRRQRAAPAHRPRGSRGRAGRPRGAPSGRCWRCRAGARLTALVAAARRRRRYVSVSGMHNAPASTQNRPQVHLSDRTGGLLLQELRPFVDELLVG